MRVMMCAEWPVKRNYGEKMRGKCKAQQKDNYRYRRFFKHFRKPEHCKQSGDAQKG